MSGSVLVGVFIAGAFVTAICFLAPKPQQAVRRSLAISTLVVCVFANEQSGDYWVGAFVGSFVLVVLAMMCEPKKIPIDRAIIVSVVWWGIVSIQAAWLSRSMRLGHFLIELPLLFVVIFATKRLSLADVYWCWRALVKVACFEALWGVQQFFLKPTKPIWGYSTGGVRYSNIPGLSEHVRVQGTMGHPILYSLLLAVAFAGLMNRSVVDWRPRWRLAAGALLLAAIVMSGSRSPFVAVVIIVAVYALQAVDLTRWVRNMTVLVIGGVAVYSLLGTKISLAIDELYNSGSYEQRISSISSFHNLISRGGLEAWFGVGFGGVHWLYSEHLLYSPYGFEVVDNWFIYVLGTMGIVGSLVFVVYFLTFWFGSDRVGKAALGGFVAYGFVFDVFTQENATFIFVLVSALGVAARQMMKGSASADADRVTQREESGNARVNARAVLLVRRSEPHESRPFLNPARPVDASRSHMSTTNRRVRHESE